MLGLIITALSSCAHEAGVTIGKWENQRRKESPYTLGFLDTLGVTTFFLAFTLLVPAGFFAPGFPEGFRFDPASLPTLIARLVLEVCVAWAAVFALVRCDRSTFGFVRVLTIPLILLVDLALGYVIVPHQFFGMALIVGSLVLLMMNHGLRRRGMGLAVVTAVGAVGTISLYKYNITHFNSVETEQTIACATLVVFFYVMARWRSKDKPLRMLLRPVFFAQSLLAGIGGLLFSFAYLFGSASVITTAKRAFDILLSLLSGRIYFHEKHLWLKVASFALIVAGLLLLV